MKPGYKFSSISQGMGYYRDDGVSSGVVAPLHTTYEQNGTAQCAQMAEYQRNHGEAGAGGACCVMP